MEQCLLSVQRAIKNIEAEIWVIDNCSTDGSLAYLEPHFPDVHFIKNEINTGFARANNKAVASCSGDYILFLNPDTLLCEDTLEKCLAVFSTHPTCSAMGVRMLDGHGRFLPESKRAIPTATNSFFKMTGLAGLFPRSAIFNGYALGHLDEEGVYPVEALSGAFMMVQRKSLLATGGFDEAYFMYGEDIDLSYRLAQSGAINIYNGQAKIIHFKGESTSKHSRQYVKRFYGAMQLFVSKHYKKRYNTVQRFFLRAGIFLGALLSNIKNFFLRLFTFSKPGIKPGPLYLFGNTDGVDAAKKMLVQQGIRDTDMQVIASEDWQQGTIPTNATIIFCMQGITLEATIACIQEIRAATFLWHYPGSENLVGAGCHGYTF